MERERRDLRDEGEDAASCVVWIFGASFEPFSLQD